MTNIFKNTNDLRKFVRINAQTSLEVWMPGVYPAKQQIAGYISAELLEKVEEYAKTPTDCKNMKNLLPYIQRVMAPMIMLNISAELSMSIGEGGHAVMKSDNALPASDAKIQKYEDSLKKRIDISLEALLCFLDANIKENSEYENSVVYKRRSDCLFRSADELQNIGLVNIQHSHIVYETLRESIIRIQERFIRELVGDELYKELLGDVTSEKQELKKLAARYCANRAVGAYLQANKDNKNALYFVPADYHGDANFYFDELNKYYIDNAEALGANIYSPPEFNKPEQKIFSAIL